MSIKGILLPSVILAVAVFTGCSGGGGRKLGTEIPADAQIIRLADVFADPADYNGKDIVMKGVVSGQCAALCEFFFKDGAHRATIFPQGYKLPRMETGKPVTVYARITSGPENVAISALGLRIE